MAILGEVS
jgi:hypothetical protein